MSATDIRGIKVINDDLAKHYSSSNGSRYAEKISHAGLVARSPEGTAAKGMNIRGNEDLWVEIQANTFRNWVNEHLKTENMQVNNWATDFCDGTRLCALVEVLQKRPLKPNWKRQPVNQHHYLENVTTALNAIEADHVKLVNIGNVDIVNGNVKLILGLIWSLIVRYQIGRSKFPPRKLMLAWLQAVLPDCKITNLTTDWNSGINLAALLEYCQPGLYPHWRSLDPNHAVSNCSHVMNIAQKKLGVPMVLEPEYLASPWLDELSGMTYLSYFMKPGGPGYNATMRWVNSQIRRPVKNFTTDWNDGHVFCEIIRGLGGQAPVPEKLSSDPSQYEHNVRKAVDAGIKLGVQPILSPRDMANAEVEHLGIMSYAAHLEKVKPRPFLTSLINVHLASTSGRVGEPMYFCVELLSNSISLNSVKAYIAPPTGNPIHVRLNPDGEGVFVPENYGMHEILVEIDNDSLGGHFFRALPRFLQVSPPNMAPCALGSLIEVLVNATGTPKSDDIRVTAVSPTGISHNCPLEMVQEGHSAKFKPDEAGIWEIAITYQGRHIQGGPFTCSVFDLSGVSVHGLENVAANRAHSFDVDARGVGVIGELHVDIVHEKRSIACAVDKIMDNKYRVTFLPRKNGKYRVYIYFNGFDVKGAPFILRVGSKERAGKTQSSSKENSTNKSSTKHYSSTVNSRHKAYDTLDTGEHYFGRDSSEDRRLSESPLYFSQNVSTDYTSSSGQHIYNQSNKRNITPVSSPVNVEKSKSEKFKYVGRTETPTFAESLRTNRESPKFTEHLRIARESPKFTDHLRISRESPKFSEPIRTTRESPKFSETVRTTREVTIDNSSNVQVSSKHTSARRDSWDAIEKTKHILSETPKFSDSFYLSPKLSVDNSSNVPVSSKLTSARRDSWDVLEKTKHLFSHNSLESLANISENRLNTNLSYNRHEDNERNSSLYNRYSREEDIRKNTKYEEHSNTFTTGSLGRKGVIEHEIDYNTQSKFHPITKKVSQALIEVGKIPNGRVGQPVEFQIDGSKAGSGNLEILVNGGRVTSSVRSLGEKRFIACFIPHEEGVHTVQVTFNGEVLKDSPWHVNIMSASKLTSLGDSTRLIPVNTTAVFEILPPPGLNVNRGECIARVSTPSKHELEATVTHKDENGALRIEFVPKEVGTHIIEASIDGTTISGGPLIAKVYDISNIKVTDVHSGVVNKPCQFRVDASTAGEGQLEISINEGEVPNHVQVVSGGRCLVSFTPEQAKPHLIDIKFNGETVYGCPYVCNVADTSCVLINLSNLELIPVNRPASFHITMRKGGAAELTVSVCGPKGELPVRITGDINTGFSAEFTPVSVGAHSINVEYNGFPVHGSPFLAKTYDATKVVVGGLSRGMVGHPSQFTVDASDAGEGNLEITITSRGQNIPTQVQPQGSARFSVTFVPASASEHMIHVSFNKISVPGCPIAFKISGAEPGPQVSFAGPGPINESNYFVINHNGGRLEDIEVNVEGPAGQSIPAQVHQTSEGVFKAEFVPRAVGEHKVNVTVNGLATAGSPYAAKVYDVNAIKVKNVTNGCVGKTVTFLVETSHAGPGNLEVTVNGGRVPTSAQAQGPHIYAISFTPREAQKHTVELRFNGQNVPGSPFACHIAAAARIQTLETEDKVNIGHLFEFIVESEVKPIVDVLGPGRKTIPVQIDTISTGLGFKVGFKPVEVGDHSVEVRLPGSGLVDGSPFLLKAYSVEKVFVTDIHSGVVGKSVSFGINASQAGAGNLEIIVAVNGKNVPNFVQSEGNAHFKVTFKPSEAAIHFLSVRFNGHAVPGSPFTCLISPANFNAYPAAATGEGLKQAAVNVENTFVLEGFGNIPPQVLVTSPCGDHVSCQIKERDAMHEVYFKPTVVGRHLISVTANNQHINGSPFSCNVFDVSRVTVRGLDKKLGPAVLNMPVLFSVDAAGSGEGTLELVVSTETGTVKAEVVACARGLYEVTFVPKTIEVHYVNITFNDLPVNGSPFLVDIQPATQSLQVGSIAKIEIPNKWLLAEILGPDDKALIHTATEQTVEFQTSLVGNYVVRFYDSEINNYVATRTLNSFDASQVKIVAVSEAFCHRPASILLCVTEAGQGNLSAIVRCGSNEVPHSIRETSNIGTFEIIYHPTRLATHKMVIFFNDVPISFKPLEINVLPASSGKEFTVSGLGLYQARVGKTTTFSIDTLKKPAREFDVVISGSEGQAYPVRCYQTKSGYLQAEFTINKPGQCHIEVLHQAKLLPGSPFLCEAVDSNKVKVQSLPTGPVPLHSTVSLTVRTEDAGLAELEAFCLSPNNKNVSVRLTKATAEIYNVAVVPKLSGKYKLFITYGGDPISISPITFNVSTSSAKNDAQAADTALGVCQSGRESFFIMQNNTLPHVQIKKLEEFGERVEPKVTALSDNKWLIIYTLLSVGHYEIRGSCPKKGNLPGSPWHILCVEPSKVTPVGGWGSLLDNEGRLIIPVRIIFNIAEAGPGELLCKIDKKEVGVEKIQENQLAVFINSESLTAGEHELDLTWSGQPINKCPRSAYVTAQQDADKVILSGRGLTEATAGEVAHFTIDATKAPIGRPEVELVYQDNTTLPVSVSQPRPNENIWLASYTPLKSYSESLTLSVKWNGRLMKGCPFNIALGLSMDASKVICSGEGLRHGIVGKDIKSWIDTRRAGPGELTAHCVGPRKSAFCELYEHGDATFTLNVKPQESGLHRLTIKYGGQNVPGSPFALKVAGMPDASKVRVYGPGIEHGVLATFQSRFTCDTRGAGAGQLTVRVRGPKGAFRVEMQRESQKDRTILCKYDPTEPGDYRVEVKWAGTFVPGSPFPVMIFDTEEELRRYLHGV